MWSLFWKSYVAFSIKEERVEDDCEEVVIIVVSESGRDRITSMSSVGFGED